MPRLKLLKTLITHALHAAPKEFAKGSTVDSAELDPAYYEMQKGLIDDPSSRVENWTPPFEVLPDAPAHGKGK